MPCSDCPFKRKGHIPLKKADADDIASFVESGNFFVCHNHESLDCAGAMEFKQGGNKEVFGSRDEMVAAYPARAKSGWKTYGISED